MQINEMEQVACALSLIASTIMEYPELGEKANILFERLLPFAKLQVENDVSPEVIFDLVERIILNLENK